VEQQTSWVRGFAQAAVVILASYLVFVLIPNNLFTYLSTRTAPFTRDLLVTLWWIVGFVACCWLFVRLQRSRER
jgi:dipeptide/tripeptide permease